MSKLSRLNIGELNKLLMRPILYFITGILVIALVFSFFSYAPKQRGDDYLSIGGATKAEVYTNFNTYTASINKNKADTNIQKSQDMINYYTNVKDKNNKYSKKFDTLSTALKNTYYQQYTANIFNQPNNLTSINTCLQEIRNAINEYSTKLNEAMTSDYSPILVNKTDYETLLQLIDTTKSKINSQSLDYNKLDTHKDIEKYFTEEKVFTKLVEISQQIIDIDIDKDILDGLTATMATATTNLATRYENIQKIYNNEKSTISELKSEINEYYLYSTLVLNYTTTKLQYESINGYTDNRIHQFKDYTNTYSYELRETTNRLQFLISNNKTTTDYAMMYNSSITSNQSTTVFDYVYYGLEICGFLIIIFSIILGSSMIAGEQSSGTLNLLMIRPFSRNKILSSKIISTMIFASILTLFCTIILFITGAITFGIDATPILVVFNSTTSFVISPYLMLLIYLACLLLKIFVYVLIAITLSVAFKSYMGAVATAILICFTTAVLNIIFTNSIVYGFVPFCNFDLFKYMGGAFFNTTIFNQFLGSAMFYNSNFITSAIIYSLTITALLVISYITFNKREIK